MGRRQAGPGASTHPPASRLASSSSTSTPAIFQLPTDVWLYIFSNLPPEALAALSTACKRLLRLVDEHGWKALLARQYGSVSLDRVESSYREYTKQHSPRDSIVRSKHWLTSRYASLLDDCWADVTLRAGSVEIHAGDRKRTGGERGRREGFAIPTLTLGTQWIVVGARSELLVYSAGLSNRAAQGRAVARIKLNSRPLHEQDAPDASTSTKSTNGAAADDPWGDITALERVNAEASLLAVGFATGSMQIVALKGEQGAKGRVVKAEVVRHFGSARRQEVVGLSICGGTSSAPASTGTSAGTSQTDLWIASLSKRGCLRIHTIPSHQDDIAQTCAWQIDSEGVATPLTTDSPATDDTSGANTPRTNFRSAAFNNAPLFHDPFTPSPTRAWSVLLGNSVDTRHHPRTEDQRWVAVGITGVHAVYLYPFNQGELQEPFYVASTGQRTSAYATGSPPAHSTLPSFLLFVGFYDGVVRVYDTRQMHTTPTSSGAMDMDDLSDALNDNTATNPVRGSRRRIKRELDPIAVFREEYDTDAIYSLSFGGTKADRLVVGGARHAKVRVFDVSDLAAYDLPMLSGPGPGGRVKGRERGDWTAFALVSNSPQYQVVAGAERVVGVTEMRLWWFDFGLPLLEAERKEEQSVAYFRHRDGVLSYSDGRFQHR